VQLQTLVKVRLNAKICFKIPMTHSEIHRLNQVGKACYHDKGLLNKWITSLSWNGFERIVTDPRSIRSWKRRGSLRTWSFS